jgi:arginase family enzyme
MPSYNWILSRIAVKEITGNKYISVGGGHSSRHKIYSGYNSSALAPVLFIHFYSHFSLRRVFYSMSQTILKLSKKIQYRYKVF